MNINKNTHSTDPMFRQVAHQERAREFARLLRKNRRLALTGFVAIALGAVSTAGLTQIKKTNNLVNTNQSGEQAMKISQTEKEENLKKLIDENHDLTGLKTKVAGYLADAEKVGAAQTSKLEKRIGGDNKVLATLDQEIFSISEEMQGVFLTLKTELLAIKGKVTAEGEESPMIPIMMAYKKSLFKVKGDIDKVVPELVSAAGGDAELEPLFREKLLNSVEIKALSGLGELEDTGVLHKILLKLTFSLASIDVKVPFIDWAPEDVVEQFWAYLTIQRRDGLQIPFVEYYKSPTAY